MGLACLLWLLLLGLTFLPRPGVEQLENLFSLLWLSVLLTSAAGFAEDLWKQNQMAAFRRRRRQKRTTYWVKAGRLDYGSDSRKKRLD